MVRERKIKREDALQILKKRPIVNDEKELIKYILEKIDISEKEFKEIMKSKNKNFKNYKTYYNYRKYLGSIAKITYKLDLIPKILYLKYFGSDH